MPLLVFTDFMFLGFVMSQIFFSKHTFSPSTQNRWGLDKSKTMIVSFSQKLSLLYQLEFILSECNRGSRLSLRQKYIYLSLKIWECAAMQLWWLWSFLLSNQVSFYSGPSYTCCKMEFPCPHSRENGQVIYAYCILGKFPGSFHILLTLIFHWPE